MKIIDHEIIISYHPDDPNFGETTPYSWMISKWTGNGWANSGYCDWAETVDKAFEEAKKACDRIYEEHK
jgi:hypothetical protein